MGKFEYILKPIGSVVKRTEYSKRRIIPNWFILFSDFTKK